MKILAINSGSSSIKFKLFIEKKLIASGLIEQIGESISHATLNAKQTCKKQIHIKNHEEGFLIMQNLLKESNILNNFSELNAVGHRIVHGGNYFYEPTLVNDEVLEKLTSISELAPLHNPAHIEGIKAVLKLDKNIKQICIFDTSFYKTMPKKAYMYAIDYEYYKKYKIRKYGFHGTSHDYVSSKACEFLDIPKENFNAISLHLGNGSSITAIKNGKAIDTSMGFSPLEGLIMGTRCGDIDPAALFFLGKKLNLCISQLDQIANKQSGLKGICKSNDLREIESLIQQDDKLAKLAFDMFIHRILKYIGAYMITLKRVDALIFTAGIGENSSKTRQKILKELKSFKVKLDEEKNEEKSNEIRFISKENSKIKALVVPTNEELKIAIECENLLKTKY